MKAKVKVVLRYLFGMLFIAAGINHFLRPEFYESIIPPWLPSPSTLNVVSGIAEIVLGALLLFHRWQRVAGWGLIALLIAIFPANLHMALHPDQYPGWSPLLYWIRLPLQGVAIAWAYWYTREERTAPLRDNA